MIKQTPKYGKVAAASSLVLIGGLALTACGGGSNTSADSSGKKTLTVITQRDEAKRQSVDNNKKGVSPGDVSVVGGITKSEDGSSELGTYNALVSVVESGKNGVVTLSNTAFNFTSGSTGTLFLNNRVSEAGDVHSTTPEDIDGIAIVGGTGDYAGARGTATETKLSDGRKWVFTYTVD